MPYTLRKVPGKHLWWVVDPSGRHLSKEGLPRERAEAQRRAVYASEHQREMEGGTTLFKWKEISKDKETTYEKRHPQYWDPTDPIKTIRELEKDQQGMREMSHALSETRKTGCDKLLDRLGALGARVIADDLYEHEGEIARRHDIPMYSSYKPNDEGHLNAQNYIASGILQDTSPTINAAKSCKFISETPEGVEKFAKAVKRDGYGTIDMDAWNRLLDAKKGKQPPPTAPAPAPAPARTRALFPETYEKINPVTGEPIRSAFFSPAASLPQARTTGPLQTASFEGSEPRVGIDEALDATDMTAEARKALQKWQIVGPRGLPAPAPAAPAASSRSPSPPPARATTPPPARAPSPPPRAPSPPAPVLRKKTKEEVQAEQKAEKEARDREEKEALDKAAAESQAEAESLIAEGDARAKVLAQEGIDQMENNMEKLKKKKESIKNALVALNEEIIEKNMFLEQDNDKTNEEQKALLNNINKVFDIFLEVYKDKLETFAAKRVQSFERKAGTPVSSLNDAKVKARLIWEGKQGKSDMDVDLTNELRNNILDEGRFLFKKDKAFPRNRTEVEELFLASESHHEERNKLVKRTTGYNMRIEELKRQEDALTRAIRSVDAQVKNTAVEQLKLRLKYNLKPTPKPKTADDAIGVKGEGRRHKHRRHGGCESCGGNDRYD